MYKAVKKIKAIQRHMEALELHTGSTSVHWEYNTSYISAVESKIVTTRVKHIYIPVCFLQWQFDNDIFVPKYDKSRFMPADMLTKPFAGPIIIRSTKWMTGFRLYPTIDT